MTDEEGFSRFYATSRDELCAAVTLTLGDRQLAVDAVDEALARAAERWEQVEVMDRPGGWVYRVAINWATSWRRKWSKRPTMPVEALDQVHRDDLGMVTMLERLAQLPLAQRQMLVLRYVLGYSVSQTAEALDVAEGTIKSGVHRARQQLKADVETADEAR